MTHIPAPWHFDRNRDEITIYADNDWPIAHLIGFGHAGTARLIAAAPELLDALKHCVIERSEWLDEARAAIAKATGDQP